MAETTNVALKKIAGSENWRNIFDHYNNSMDIADDEINTIENAIAILANGNTHVAITTGQRVYVRNHDTLASGLYKATADIAANKVLSSSNLEAEPDGGLNSLAEDIATNASDIASQNQALTNIQNGLAIMANGDTHAAITAGKAVYVRNHSTLTDGLYWATAAIATNGALSTSNLAADASGGLNKLKGDIDSLNSKIENNAKVFLLRKTVTSAGETLQLIGNIVIPANESWQVTLTQNWSSGRPKTCGLSNTDNAFSEVGTYSSEPTQRSFIIQNGGAGTKDVYVWGSITNPSGDIVVICSMIRLY